MLELANDCFRFITGYFEIISASSPHIYHSALALAPKKSIVWNLYGSHAHPFTRVVHGAPASRDTDTAVTTRPFRIERAAWSPCHRFIAITWDYTTTIDVLDSVTLQRLQILEPQQGVYTHSRGLVFSPDSRILTSSGYRHEELYVESWDLQTGGVASTIRWQEPWTCLSGDPSIIYSANGKMVGVFYYHGDTKTNIFICDVVSGVCMYSHSLGGDIPIRNDIWTHGESLRFATANATTITIWEVGFTSGVAPMEVETLPNPDGFNGSTRTGARFLPAPCRLALALEDKVLVWDVQNSKCLLRCTDTGFRPRMSFSADGRLFACSTTGSDIYLWKESPTGYILHEILASSTASPSPLLSRNGDSIVAFGGPTIRLWRTKGFTAPPSSISTRAPQHTGNFILGFSPDGMLAAVAVQKDNTVTVLDLKSGVRQLTIDVGVEIYGLGVVGNTAVAIGDREVTTWNLPAGDCNPDARVGPEDSSWTISLGDLQGDHTVGASISPDSRHIALATTDSMGLGYLRMYSASTGEYLGYSSTWGHTPWFAPDGCNLWCAHDSGNAQVWRVGGGGGVLETLKLTVDIEHPPEGYPWGSPRGYRVTNDWWILGPNGKRLLMLPPPWQSDVGRRVWNGQFLVLLHGGLSEPVFLGLEP